jgi:hypothetical protein
VIRWWSRILGAALGTAVIIAVILGAKMMMSRDPGRKRMADALEATAQLRYQLGRDAHIRMRALPDDGTDDDLEITVVYPAATPDPERRDLLASSNIIVRRHMPHVREVRIVFGETPQAELPPGLEDGGTAITQNPHMPPPVDPSPPRQAPAAGPSAASVVAPPSPTGPPAQSAAPAAPPGKKAAPAPAAPKPKGPVAMGSITLVTFPDSNVKRGGQSLGKTPLFNCELPVGTHLLTLYGEDGSRHSLSVQVKAGKNAPIKVNLADIPAR